MNKITILKKADAIHHVPTEQNCRDTVHGVRNTVFSHLDSET